MQSGMAKVHIALLSDSRDVQYTYHRIATDVPFRNHFTHEHQRLGVDRDHRIEMIT
ncbi:hypothetical protein HETIRDRAFT_168832 [Heterobasidion irregulare TC 32-1]|uniref:Uncharacterized protein n=1 Tax=Heterobasidion irregulare (strain TC 32-1) TaxID=747525 RepID=W4KA40_HETIT|nr:uncharacterized protein HETIRDRAFT_168832 [Heterobasidion irregulare TC 32-1]ETW82215.1 hypothetical protein HETIRDRAFT_168832 [Heterobasidion irregulare TC 32-1]